MTEPQLTVSLPPELVDVLAERVAAILAERQPAAEDGWLRGADRIASYIDAPVSRVYALSTCKPSRIPVHRDGSALVARRSALDHWIENGGARRP